MLRPATKTNRGGIALAWGGGAVVLVAVLQFLREELVAFNLDKWPLLVASAAIFLTGLAIGEIGSARARRLGDRELEDKLDEALACWPPQRAADLSPYDIGVRPTLRAEAAPVPYIERDADAEIAEAFSDADVIVVFGPEGAGKSRTAFNAIPGDAILLVPEDAEGMATLLRRCTSLVIQDDSAVLWLDDFDRYAEGVDVDPILAFLQSPPKRSWLRRFLRRLRRGSEDSPTLSVKVVATIDSDGLEELLAGNHAVRRLMAGARGVFLPASFSAAERQRFEAEFGRLSEGDTVAAAFSSTWQRGWRAGAAPPARPATPWSTRKIPAMPILLGLMALAAVVWLFAKGVRDELTVPLPIDQQAAAFVGEATCPVEVFPAKGEGLTEDEASNGSVLVAIEHGGECGVSDRIRFYRQRDRRLREIATLSPEPSASLQRFECRGPTKGANPCHVNVQGNEQYIVGAFRDAETRQEVPVAISFEDDGLGVSPLALPKPKLGDVPPSIRRLGERPVELRLRVADSDLELEGSACEDSAYCSRSRAAQVTAVVPRQGERPALLVAGYTIEGTTDSPRLLLVQMWKLVLQGGRPTATRNCVALRNGRVLPVVVNYGEAALHKGWRPKGSDIMC